MNQRIYIIGAGMISRHHAEAIKALPNSESVSLSVTDVNPETLADFRQHFPQAKTFADVKSLLAEPSQENDIVIVATPPFTHCDLACQALASGRNVLVEKPLAMNMEQAHKMLQLARQHNRSLGCCSSRSLGLPTTEAVKELIHSSALGKLYHVSFMNRRQRGRPGIEYQPTSRWFIDSKKSGGGTLMDWGPYDFTTLNDVLDPVRIDVISAWTAYPLTDVALPEDVVFDVEEHVGATLKYTLENHHTVNVTFERAACTHGGVRSVVEIEGDLGAVTWDWLCFGEREVVHSFDNVGKLETKRVTYEPAPVNYMDRPLVYFYRHLQGEASPAPVNEKAVFNFSCLGAIYECARTGQAQVVTRGAV